MKFTAQEEYGLRLMLAFTRPTRVGPSDGRTIPHLAAMERVRASYVGKLMGILRRARLVVSKRGRSGCYVLARPASEISVGEVLAALGGDLFNPSYCAKFTGDQAFCVHTTDCSVRSLWAALNLMVKRVLDRTMLSDLVRTERSMDAWLAGRVAEAEAAIPGVQSSKLQIQSCSR